MDVKMPEMDGFGALEAIRAQEPGRRRQLKAGEIAAKPDVSEETVKGRVRNILGELGANDRTQAAVLGLRRSIIT